MPASNFLAEIDVHSQGGVVSGRPPKLTPTASTFLSCRPPHVHKLGPSFREMNFAMDSAPEDVRRLGCL